MGHVYFYQTDVGTMVISENGKGITDIYFTDTFATESIVNQEGVTISAKTGAVIAETPMIKAAYQQLQEYFTGTRKQFDFPLDLQGTEFQQKVWKALVEIPYGSTRSYGEVAAAIGQPKAARAVGMANNRNPLCVVVPCHRVIGSNGKLVGYAGGIHIKEYLLRLEKSILAEGLDC